MKTTGPFFRMFAVRDDAMSIMRELNRAAKRAGNAHDLFVVAPGPEDDWAVMDVKSAIELDLGYTWET